MDEMKRIIEIAEEVENRENADREDAFEAIEKILKLACKAAPVDTDKIAELLNHTCRDEVDEAQDETSGDYKGREFTAFRPSPQSERDAAAHGARLAIGRAAMYLADEFARIKTPGFDYAEFIKAANGEGDLLKELP